MTDIEVTHSGRIILPASEWSIFQAKTRLGNLDVSETRQ